MIISPTGYWTNVVPGDHVVSEALSGYQVSYFDRSSPTYDFGCGSGGYLARLHVAGFQDLTGFEGDPMCAHLAREFGVTVYQQDLTAPMYCHRSRMGNVICLEVGEHIPPEHADVFLDNITDHCKERMVISWAVRGQSGDGHVNCLNNPEVIPLFERRGFVCDYGETEKVRRAIVSNPMHFQGGNPDKVFRGYFQSTAMVFKRIIDRGHPVLRRPA